MVSFGRRLMTRGLYGCSLGYGAKDIMMLVTEHFRWDDLGASNEIHLQETTGGAQYSSSCWARVKGWWVTVGGGAAIYLNQFVKRDDRVLKRRLKKRNSTGNSFRIFSLMRHSVLIYWTLWPVISCCVIASFISVKHPIVDV